MSPKISVPSRLAAREKRGYAARMRPLGPTLTALTIALCLAGCKSTDTKQDGTTAAKADQPGEKDKSRCDTSGKKITTVDINNDGKADVWKFYATVMENGAKLEVLTCKEVDLNKDGKKDAWIYYENGGNVANEEFDTDFDGRIDMWTYRQNGKIVREEYDSDFDGKPDIWKFFENEKLTRLERSTKKNGKVDVWEYYEGGKLERIGYDTTGSGQIDRWDRAPEETPMASTAPSGGAPGAPGSAAPAPASAAGGAAAGNSATIPQPAVTPEAPAANSKTATNPPKSK
jgi:antitoxin component YwqK of YwqJK toxin-antitoxin module